MLAGCGLCIINADCDWAVQAIGYNLGKKKNQKVEWTRAELTGNLTGDGEERDLSD